MTRAMNHNSIGRLFDELADSVLENKDEAREVLEEAGKDPEEVRARGREFIEKMKGKARLARAEAKKEKLGRMRERLHRKLDRQAQGNPKELLARAMAEGSEHGVQFHFRNIEDLSDEDALEMLDEIQLIHLWEKLREEDDE